MKLVSNGTRSLNVRMQASGTQHASFVLFCFVLFRIRDKHMDGCPVCSLMDETTTTRWIWRTFESMAADTPVPVNKVLLNDLCLITSVLYVKRPFITLETRTKTVVMSSVNSALIPHASSMVLPHIVINVIHR